MLIFVLLPRAGDHHRGRGAGGRGAAHHALRHRHDQVHLLRLLPGGVSRGRHSGGEGGGLGRKVVMICMGIHCRDAACNRYHFSGL